MVELFTNLPEEVKKQHEEIVNFALENFEPQQILSFLKSYINSCKNEEEKEFVNFYFSLRMEKLLNENNNDKW